MRQRVGHIDIETIAAERSKFTAPMVLVHGLWCTSRVWHKSMGYLAHRGWDCHAINLRGRSTGTEAPTPPSAGIADHLDDLNAVIGACDSPPVVVGHDLGGLLALSGALAPPRAIIALAPLIPPPWRDTPLPGLSGLRARIDLRWRGRLPPPRGQTARDYFGSVPPQPTVSEAAVLADDLGGFATPFTVKPTVPALIVIGDADRISPLPVVAKLAADIGAEIEPVAGGGHALPWESGWQDRVTALHRWLIRTLGDSLLAMLDEEDAD